jgi:hypothetical protein
MRDVPVVDEWDELFAAVTGGAAMQIAELIVNVSANVSGNSRSARVLMSFMS